MISVYQAEHIILNNAKPFPLETLPLSQAYGRLLRENIKNDRVHMVLTTKYHHNFYRYIISNLRTQ